MASPGDPAIVERAVALAQRGAVGEACGLLIAAMDRGDALAAVQLADWRLAGDPIRRDLAEARELYGKAAAGGVKEAEPVYIALLANGAGGSGRRWSEALTRLTALARRDSLAKRQLALLAAMDVDEQGEPRVVSQPVPTCERPRIEQFPGFLSLAECRYLIELALPQLQPATVAHPQTGHLVRDPVRLAGAAMFPFVAEDPVLHAINRRIAAATGTTYEQGEPLQVLSYEPGQEYKLHSDALPGPGNQRVATVLVSLGDHYDGGETDFPRVGVRWRGKPGEAIHFRNVDGDGKPDGLAWHAGLPVRRGRKFLLSKWLRARPLDLSGPPGRPF